MIIKPSSFYITSENSESIIPLKCCNLTEGKTITVNINKMDMSDKNLKKLAKKIRRIIKTRKPNEDR